ncbi:MAG: hypothetical protein HY514_02485 [Candidatus Aenigmarchaeota archaeon]|nr:hypothetical protein [Candidatus Aenigmarchaeota archaeon]
MPDWKIVVTLLIVLGVLAVFVSSAPPVSNFFDQIATKLSDTAGVIGIGWGEKSNIDFLLELEQFEDVDFEASNSTIIIEGIGQANFGESAVAFRSVSILGFTGSGSFSEKFTLKGFASSVAESSGFKLQDIRFNLSADPDKLNATDVLIKNILFEDAQGQITLNNSFTRFQGRLEMRSVSTSLTLEKNVLKIKGKAKYIAIPSAGIRIG